jgi:hypothetical protein
MNTEARVYEVFYTASYTGVERSQLFRTAQEAEGMKRFYESCGSSSWVKERTINTL